MESLATIGLAHGLANPDDALGPPRTTLTLNSGGMMLATMTTWTMTTWLLFLPLPILQPDVSISLTDNQQATIAFWNLENLFDFEDDPNNPGDDEFLPEKEWDEARYLRKLDHLARAVDSLDAQLLAVC